MIIYHITLKNTNKYKLKDLNYINNFKNKSRTKG